MKTEISKAAENVKSLVLSLRAANAKASAVESIITLDLIHRAANLKADVEILLDALDVKEA